MEKQFVQSVSAQLPSQLGLDGVQTVRDISFRAGRGCEPSGVCRFARGEDANRAGIGFSSIKTTFFVIFTDANRKTLGSLQIKGFELISKLKEKCGMRTR